MRKDIFKCTFVRSKGNRKIMNCELCELGDFLYIFPKSIKKYMRAVNYLFFLVYK